MTTYYDSVVTGTSGNTHYYPFEGNGNDAKGSTNMTVASGYSTSSGGREGNALTADGSAKTGSTLAGLSSIFGSTYSIEIWFKLTGSATQELMRLNDEVALEMGTDGKILYYYEGSIATTSAAYNDNAWHLLTITRDSSRNVIVYIDGTSVITFTVGTTNPSSGNIYFAGSQYTGQAFISGQMDSVAIYNVALSSGTVTAHLNAMGGAAPTVAAMTASADIVAPTVTTNTHIYSVTDDVDPSGFGTTATTLTLGAVGGATYFKTGAVSINGGDVLYTAKLRTWVTAVSSPALMDVYQITSAWTEGSPAGTTATYVKTIDVSGAAASGFFDFDVTEVVANWLGGAANYGVALLSSSGTITVASSENGTTTHRPTLALVSGTPVNVAPSISAMTASAAMPTASITITADKTYSATPMTADATLVNPTVGINGNVSITAEHMDVYVDVPGGAYSGPTTVAANPMTASVAGVDPSVAVQVSAIISAPPMTALSQWKKPALVNGVGITIPETEDAYFNRVLADDPAFWFRMNELGNAVDRANPGGFGGLYHGVVQGQTFGPEGRASVYFDGNAYIEQQEVTGTNRDETLNVFSDGKPHSSLEFSFRTTKANTFIAGGKDDLLFNPGQINATEGVGAGRDIFLYDGKIAYVTQYLPFSTYTKEPYTIKGFRNLNDGNWHHVVIQGYDFGAPGGAGVDIFVDGKFEVRRSESSGAIPLYGFPDYIGIRPDNIDGIFMGTLNPSYNFVGDMSEFVFYDHLLSNKSISRHYYDFMGWHPIESGTAEAFAFATAGNKGKGNQKKALGLIWDLPQKSYQVAGSPAVDNGPNTDPMLGRPATLGGFKMVYVQVFGNGTYRDKVTDYPRLFSFMDDVDISEYSAVFCNDWPQTGAEFDLINTTYPGSYENLLSEMRWANDQGLGLFITQPRLAADLGIIDRYEWTPTLGEQAFSAGQGNAFGLYDYGSALKFPWNIAGSSGIEGWAGTGSRYNGEPQNLDNTYLNNKAYFYGDTNKNDKYRVRATIAGLTDLPSYMIEDCIFETDYSGWGWQIQAFKYLHRMDGLRIGDEFHFHGTDMGLNPSAVSYNYDIIRGGRWRGTWGTPVEHVKAGTVVTTFGAQIWQGHNIADNPYKDYATTIVLEPGDSLKGRAVGGKIYVNFSEQPSGDDTGVAVQVLPTGSQPWPAGYNPDTTEQKQWEWSDTRKSLNVTGSPTSSVTVNVTLPGGQIVGITGTTPSNGLNMTRSSNIFPVEYYPSLQMNRRGMLWLYDQAVTPSEGDTNQRVEAATATAAMPSPSTVAQRSNNVLAEPMVALAQMPKVAEDKTGDVEIRMLPMTAHADFTGFSKVISATPMTATAELVENFDMVHATGEQVVVFLNNEPLVTLFIKEEA